MYNKDEVLDRLNFFRNRLKELGGFTKEFTCEEVAKEEDILKLEEELGYSLPIEFRKALEEISSEIYFYWSILDSEDDSLSLPEEFEDIFSGELSFGIDLTLSCEESRKGWIDNCFPDYDDPYDKIFHNKLAFHESEYGDFFAIDLEKDSYGKVVFLSHEGDDLNGYVMANSFSEFLEEYTRLGCVGGEEWELFTNNQTTPIDSACENEKKWLEIIY